MQRPRTLTAVLVPLTFLAAGVLFATSAETADGNDLRAGRSELTELISAERDALMSLQQRAAALRETVRARSATLATRDARVAAELARANPLARIAGLSPVRGPSLTVTLDDAPPEAESTDPNDLVIHQQDLQAVVNGLWAGGAEAMTLMGQRIIATSAVRCVGNTVLLHGRVYGPPFVITAVGDRAGMRRALQKEPGVRVLLQYVDAFGLGYAITGADETVLTGYSGPLELPSVAEPA